MSYKVELQLPNGKDYLSYSSSKKLYKSPLEYLRYVDDEFVPNEGMIFGTYYEAFLWDDKKTLDKFFVFDDEKLQAEANEAYTKEKGSDAKNIKATSMYKSMRADLLDKVDPTFFITKEEHNKSIAMADIMRDSGVFNQYLKGDTQVVKTKEIDTGLYRFKALVKCDVRLLTGDVNDLKTTSDELSRFGSNAKYLDYDVQDYLTKEVFGVDEFNFVVQRTKDDLDVGVFSSNRDSYFFNSGRDKVNKAIKNYLDWLSPDAKNENKNPINYVSYQNLY